MAKTRSPRSAHPPTEITKLLRQIAHRHNMWQVFRDFVAMAALSLSNAADPVQAPKREAEYMQIVSRYTREEAMLMAQAFAELVNALEAGPEDVLGSLYMSLELGDNWKGQFFTPYPVCQMMAGMTMLGARDIIAKNGFVRVSDPCVGGGAMLIAAAHALMDAGINYQHHMHAEARDVDLTAVHMAYVQLSLLHVPAIVVHGNTLTLETHSTWRTLAHTMGFWETKLKRQAATQQMHEIAELLGFDAPPAASVQPSQASAPHPTASEQEPALHPPTVESRNAASQLTLF